MQRRPNIWFVEEIYALPPKFLQTPAYFFRGAFAISDTLLKFTREVAMATEFWIS